MATTTKDKVRKVAAIVILHIFCITQISWSSPIYKEARNLRAKSAGEPADASGKPGKVAQGIAAVLAEGRAQAVGLIASKPEDLLYPQEDGSYRLISNFPARVGDTILISNETYTREEALNLAYRIFVGGLANELARLHPEEVLSTRISSNSMEAISIPPKMRTFFEERGLPNIFTPISMEIVNEAKKLASATSRATGAAVGHYKDLMKAIGAVKDEQRSLNFHKYVYYTPDNLVQFIIGVADYVIDITISGTAFISKEEKVGGTFTIHEEKVGDGSLSYRHVMIFYPDETPKSSSAVRAETAEVSPLIQDIAYDTSGEHAVLTITLDPRVRGEISERTVSLKGKKMGISGKGAIPIDVRIIFSEEKNVRPTRLKKTIADLIEELGDDEHGITLRAAQELGRIGSDAVPELVSALEANPAGSMKAWIINSLREIGPDAVTAVSSLKTALRDKDAGVRHQAVMALGEVGSSDAIPVLQGVLGNDFKETQEQAVIALGKLGPVAILALEAALTNNEPSIRCQAVMALGEVGSSDAIPVLQQALEDTDVMVTWGALWALYQIGRPAMLALQKALTHQNEGIRRRAAELLRKIESESVEAAATPAAEQTGWRVAGMNASEAQPPTVKAEAISKKALVITDSEQFYKSVEGKIAELRNEGIDVRLLMLSGEGKLADSVAISQAKDEPGLDGVYTYLVNEASRNLVMSLGGVAYKELAGTLEEAVALLLSI